jgi:prephenate dehydrogenase
MKKIMVDKNKGIKDCKKASTKKLEDVHFGIIGLGLIGGSYAKALRKIGVKQITGVDIDRSTIEKALNDKIIDVGLLVNNTKKLKDVDVIICSIYPSALIDFIKANVCNFKEDVLLTDALGIKGEIPSKIDELLGEKMEFIAAHPMAGREGNGLSQAKAEIFDGANYILVPRKVNNKKSVLWMENFAHALGCSKVVCVNEKEHDEIIAYTSNLPHAIAVSLLNSSSMNSNTKYFIAGSFKDATRVADINEELWSDLFLANAENVVSEIQKLKNQLDRWQKALTNRDARSLKSMMKEASSKRRGMTNEKVKG